MSNLKTPAFPLSFEIVQQAANFLEKANIDESKKDDLLDKITEASMGMDLRDYFAAKAMQGIIASDQEWELKHLCDIATDSYTIADAMMKARSL